jgi:hypothetical protein
MEACDVPTFLPVPGPSRSTHRSCPARNLGYLLSVYSTQQGDSNGKCHGPVWRKMSDMPEPVKLNLRARKAGR